MARALPWQRSDKGLKSMGSIRDKAPGSLTAMGGTEHHCSPSQLWSFFMLILIVPLCLSHQGQAPQRPKTPEFINPKGRPICTRALGNYFEFHGVLSGSERSTHNYNPLALLLSFCKQWSLRNTKKCLVLLCIDILNMPCRKPGDQ